MKHRAKIDALVVAGCTINWSRHYLIGKGYSKQDVETVISWCSRPGDGRLEGNIIHIWYSLSYLGYGG